VKIGTIELVTSDFSMKTFNLDGIQNPEPIFEDMRRLVEAMRIARGVREIDQNDRIT
jgi:hypothetical protein